MKQLTNQKGMTLVEIVVVLLIASLLLVIMGSLILNSFRYFGETSDQNLSKQSLDSMQQFVRSELLYASDVKVAASKPDEEEWQVLYVQNGRLYHNDEMLYSEGFYNQKSLSMSIRGFDTYRLDLAYALDDGDSKKVYTTKDTLELLNIKIQVDGDASLDPFANISKKVEVSQTNKIYYKKGLKFEEPEKPQDPSEGTVADQIKCLNGYNNRGRFVPGTFYKIGDMTYYEGYWWINYITNWVLNEAENPASSHHWKKLDYTFDRRSVYEKDDIIFYENTYYQCNRSMINTGSSPIPNEGWDGKEYWDEVNIEDAKAALRCKENPDNLNTIANQLDYTKLFECEEFENGEEYALGTVVKITYNDNYVEYYKKIMFETGKNKPGTNPTSGWQRLIRDYDLESSYLKGDEVLYTQDEGRLITIRALQNIDTHDARLDGSAIKSDNEYWEVVR